MARLKAFIWPYVVFSVVILGVAPVMTPFLKVMELLDIHTHRLDDKNRQSIINCSPVEFFPQQGCYYSVGIHPWNVTSSLNQEWEALKRAAIHPQVLAIGEAGLDNLTSASFSLQKEIFRAQITLAEKVNKPLIIHSVRTSNEILELKKEYSPRNPWIIHGFRGKKAIARKFLEQGIYLSFGEKYQIEALQVVPLNCLFIETDESLVEILALYKTVAVNISLPFEKLIEQVQQNIRQLFFRE